MNYERREVLLTLNGCGELEAKEDNRVRFSAWAFFSDEKLTKLSIDRVTKATSSGLQVGTVDSEVNAEALNGVTEAIVSGVVKGVLSKP